MMVLIIHQGLSLVELTTKMFTSESEVCRCVNPIVDCYPPLFWQLNDNLSFRSKSTQKSIVVLLSSYARWAKQAVLDKSSFKGDLAEENNWQTWQQFLLKNMIF